MTHVTIAVEEQTDGCHPELPHRSELITPRQELKFDETFELTFPISGWRHSTCHIVEEKILKFDEVTVPGTSEVRA